MLVDISDTAQASASRIFSADRPLDDETLVVRAREADTEAFETLLRRHQQAMYRVALRLLGDPHDAQDAVQGSFLAAWRRIRWFRGESSFSTWLYRIVTNQCLNAIRARSRRPEAAAGSGSDLEATGRRSSGGGMPEMEALFGAELDALERALRTLPPDWRVAWVLRESEGLGYGEIAAVTRTSPDAVRGRIHRARTALAREMSTWR